MLADRLRQIIGGLEGPAAKLKVYGLFGSARAFLLANLHAQMKRAFLVIVPSSHDAEALVDDLSFFSGRICSGDGAPLSGAGPKVHLFPGRETLPFEPIAPPREVTGKRMEVLSSMLAGRPMVVVAPVDALMVRIMPRRVLTDQAIHLGLGEVVAREILVGKLVSSGYRRLDLVGERGDFSVRGGIVDIYPSHLPNPVRMEFSGDELESIREFSAESQISIRHMREVLVLPMREVPLSPEGALEAVSRLSAVGREGMADPSRLSLALEAVRDLRYFPGMENLLPYLYRDASLPLDFLPEGAIIAVDEWERVAASARSFLRQVREEHSRHQDEYPILPRPEELCIDAGQLEGAIGRRPVLDLHPLPLGDDGDDPSTVSFNLREGGSFKGDFASFVSDLRDWRRGGGRTILVSPNEARAGRLVRLLADHDVGAEMAESIPPLFQPVRGSFGPPSIGSYPSVAVVIGDLREGFAAPDLGLRIVAEDEIFGIKGRPRRVRRFRKGVFLPDVHELKPHDYVVHADYGIGRYLGAAFLEHSGGRGEFLQLEYADNERLYVPIERLDLVSKYMGGGDAAPKIDKLGSSSWKRAKKGVKELVRRLAAELLELYAARETVEGFSFSADSDLHREFYDSFEYEETEDQLRAMHDVLEDMERPAPMDRLICGDVGYGKTEVAIRAAFKTVMDLKQVAVLVPTTVLALQHYNTFRTRFSSYPVNIQMLSRFRSRAEQKAILRDLKEGKVDIVIGTHRLLQRDVEFSDLGLLVIDEEQRFGVAHKERLKQMRRTVDVLTLTATPIPRTLHLSLTGIRDMSVIETPPDDRQSIRTYIKRFDPGLIRESVLREVGRGGQVYFVHNRVETIEGVGRFLRELIPEVKIGIAHGQLPERVLERKMLQFVNGDFDLLLCTTIIENGLDIPSVNTLIVSEADNFGLAQLYQLRGRVGRYKHRAYAYLLILGDKVITSDARKRLQAIMELTELGSGFRLAYRDMEIRGVGNILGPEQSGHVAAVGFDLYCRLLEEAIAELRGEPADGDFWPQLELGLEGYIPESYAADTNVRLSMYRRLSKARNGDEVDRLRTEMMDRFGPLPEPAEVLLETVRVRIMARVLRISRIKRSDGSLLLVFDERTPLDAERVVGIMGRMKGDIRFIDGNTMSLKVKGRVWRDVMARLKNGLQCFVDHAIKQG